jgi:hypothetical protein
VKGFLPKVDGRALDFMKICAAIFMVIDHVNLFFFQDRSVVMFLIGRGTYPIFCYALAMALWRIGPEKGPEYALMRYSKRLLILALLVEPVSIFTRGWWLYFNVLFTLSLGAALAGMLWRMKDWQAYLCYAAAIAAVVVPQVAEFGFAGAAIPSALLRAMDGKKMAYPFLLAMIIVMNIPMENVGVISDFPGWGIVVLCTSLTVAAGVILPLVTLKFAQTMRQDGRYLSKYALHIFYPSHLMLLWLIKHFVIAMTVT